ncbi:MAG: hypothetical protein IKZ17_05210 [Bacteroidaceae bacterium]|nr:hypothetical protein [Bacteroidaceae bacterium]
MKRNILLLAMFIGMLTCGQSAIAQSSSKQQAQFSHVMTGLKLDKETRDKFLPLLIKYYYEIASVKKSHSALKDKHQKADDEGKLTDEQCDLLFNSKHKQEIDELNVRKKYYEEFKKVLTVQQAYKAIRLSNDKVK